MLVEDMFADDACDILYFELNPEVGDSGTAHLQCYLHTASVHRPTAIAKWTSRVDHREHLHMHVEAAMANVQCNINYIRKDQPDKAPYYIVGALDVSQGTNPRPLEEVKADLDAGMAARDVMQNHFAACARHYRFFERYALAVYVNRRIPRHVTWLYGPTGVGKSYGLPFGNEAYWKPPETKWFDNYQSQKIVIFDDFRKNWWSFSYMLRILDEYPMMVEVKGGTVHWLADEIYITCPVHPYELYSTNEDVAQLLRRIDVILQCDKAPGSGNVYMQKNVTGTAHSELGLLSAPPTLNECFFDTH